MTTRTKEESAVATAELAGNHGFSLISNEKLLQLYTSMVKCRMIEERAKALIERGKLTGNEIAAAGREAAAVGVAIDLRPEDAVAHSNREFIVDFIKGLPLDRIIRGLLAGGAGRETPLQLAAAIDAAQSNKMKKNDKIVAVFRDDEAASMEDWNQALRVAGADRLPMLFVSYPTVSTGLEENVASPHGFASIPVDGRDVVAVYRVATEAITHARKGNGSTLLDCRTCNSASHSETDPILRMEEYLSRKGLFSEEFKRDVADGFSRELDAAVEAAL
jgi:TPP-dependent pyruvate/acetoin dehydrogenase alpha subunit